jgi:hypothetical protein
MTAAHSNASPTPPSSAPEPKVVWEYLDGVPGVVLVAREAGVPLAMIEMSPRVGFRLTDYRSGRTRAFISVEEAQLAYRAQRESAQ